MAPPPWGVGGIGIQVSENQGSGFRGLRPPLHAAAFPGLPGPSTGASSRSRGGLMPQSFREKWGDRMSWCGGMFGSWGGVQKGGREMH